MVKGKAMTEIEMKNCLLRLKIHHLMWKLGLMIGTRNIWGRGERRERKSKKESDLYIKGSLKKGIRKQWDEYVYIDDFKVIKIKDFNVNFKKSLVTIIGIINLRS